MPVAHYENFPVASLLLPAHLRAPVEAIYAFARGADDVADEGDATATQRLARLDDYRTGLNRIGHREPLEDNDLRPMFERLATHVRQFDLPIALLRDLLDAFSQDVVKTRYADQAELLDYCRRSANPVGRLLLHLYGKRSPEQLQRADAICTSLQLINFWQDVGVDWAKQRVYIPLDELERFGVSEHDIAAQRCDEKWRALLSFQVQRARSLMLAGAPLARQLPGRIGWELRLVVLGGLRTLEKIEAAGHDVFRHRPTLNRSDWALIASRALHYKPGTP